MYVFAMPYARAHAFKAFWTTHSFYIILYILTILHGSGRLVQPPLFQWFLLPPLIIFVFDKLLSLSRNNIEISVKKADILPSGMCFFMPIFVGYYYGMLLSVYVFIYTLYSISVTL